MLEAVLDSDFAAQNEASHLVRKRSPGWGIFSGSRAHFIPFWTEESQKNRGEDFAYGGHHHQNIHSSSLSYW